MSKTNEAIRKLNEGISLVEKQNEERAKQLEKVISAEIKLRCVEFKKYIYFK